MLLVNFHLVLPPSEIADMLANLFLPVVFPSWPGLGPLIKSLSNFEAIIVSSTKRGTTQSDLFAKLGIH
jgi:hypothetical protein